MLAKLVRRQRMWLANERGTLRKDWRGRVAIALAFPNRYAVGMSNLGLQTVYGALNGLDGVVCERVFHPEPEDLDLVRENPGQLLSVESQRPVRDFDLLFFSVSFENDYPNLVEMLVLGGVPVRSEDRSADHPFVAAGGVAVFLNPEPLARFMDFIFVGESEGLIEDFWEVWSELRVKSLPRRDAVLTLGRNVSGIYVPSFYRESYDDRGFLREIAPAQKSELPERVRYRRADLSKSKPCASIVETPHAEFSQVTLVEIGRGCGQGCRFCAAGFIYRPVRHVSLKALEERVEARPGPGSRVGLVSAAVSDHPEISPLCESLIARGLELSFSSLRVEPLSAAILDALMASGHKAVAIAPEAGSERLRRVINKRITSEAILDAAERLTEKGILQLKLYFMIGLPTETLDDLDEMVDMVKAIKHRVLSRSRGRKQMGTITLSINSFVPKPFTPFQWTSFAGVSTLKERGRWIQNALRRVPNVKVHVDLPKWAYVQALMSRGDRRIADVLESIGAERIPWSQAMKRSPHNADFWVMREREEAEVFPWEIIETGLKRSYLWQEFQRALQGKESPACPPEGGCTRCGVCLD
ncbi:MAG: radical SAM protein [Syntrophobacteraceae bacterium]|jgi:radical SAM superfamily enzyme YgiQ (UPF0313 family)|nr:radical SAM protein [Syntrophobacteraceae bacterium]